MRNSKTGFLTSCILIPFRICAGFLLTTGKIFHLTYKEISVIFNLYLQGAILLLTSLLPFCAAMLNVVTAPSLSGIGIALLMLAYSSIYATGFIAMLHHYKGSKDEAFDLCVQDLFRIAGKWKMSYYAVNLVIFVGWWLALAGTNLLLAYLLTGWNL